jgi:hypothetical protein
MIAKAIDGVAEARRAMGGAAALRLAMRSSPDLLEHDRSETQQIAAIIANELMTRARARTARGWSRDVRSRRSARCSTSGRSNTNCTDDRIVEQAKELAWCYLTPYLDKRRGGGARAGRRAR